MLPGEGLSSGQTGIQKENIKSPANSAKTEKYQKNYKITKKFSKYKKSKKNGSETHWS